MITIKDIIKWSKPHPMNSAMKGTTEVRRSCFGNDKVEFSIVGGGSGLYGDFKDTFEVAIFDKETGKFMTKFFYSKATDDVIHSSSIDLIKSSHSPISPRPTSSYMSSKVLISPS